MKLILMIRQIQVRTPPPPLRLKTTFLLRLWYQYYFFLLAGFTYTRESCCQVESGSVPCKSLSAPCSNRSDYVYWDGAHFTEAKAWAFGKRAYKRQSPKDACPYDISELVKLKLDDSDAYNINHAQLWWRRWLSNKFLENKILWL